MAQKSTIFKAELQLSDLDRHYYVTHALTLARHPSETDERMMVRLLAFALLAEEGLAFAKGLSTDDEPDLWQKDLTGAIERWVEVGLPDERRLRKACGRSEQVAVFIYGGRVAEMWWQQNRSALLKLENLTVVSLPQAATQALAACVSRNMQLQCIIQDGQVWLGVAEESILIEPETLQQVQSRVR